ncbi:metal/formaldehyde-sensitive transcriptional repressor [Serratia sp. UGAL515B_01]|uniref:metal/formaldehyde-sensitive transcriptional repressor n=1 Tax=Serratia sp. UGAL515B_01 TaxID=2986763 RepID=UPI002954BCAC|nr:metal/formaldehyde-sensitive transcriptional repressor [Serratia sp. UGAL515B_01]WON78880.1 metal/formaldehyde-sensitive transcriptional repressor [Serratia sp. UGAL515B_01]
MTHTVKDKKKLLARVRRIKGQAEALERSLEHGNDCSAILQQIAAVRGAVNGLMVQVLEGHVREHLVVENATPQQREQDVEQLMSVLRSYMR